MTAVLRSAPPVRSEGVRRGGLRLVEVTVAALFVFPSDLVFKPVGAAAWIGALLSIVCALVWIGRPAPGDAVRPSRMVRLALAAFVVSSLLSWIVVPYRDLSQERLNAADRWMIAVVGFAGLALLVARAVRTRDDMVRVARVLVWGAAFSGLVAAGQWLFHIDVASVIRDITPGFQLNNDDFATYQARGALDRVTGTALHPIELGVVAGMVLPIGITLIVIDRAVRPWLRVLPVVLLCLALPASVSRSAILSAGIGLVVWLVAAPAALRWRVLLVAVVGGAVQFFIRPGYLTTLSGLTGEGANDPSVSSRLQDYALVERLLEQHPLLGTGGGTYIADNFIDILDNQYLFTAVTLGLVGIAALLLVLGLPVVGAARTWASARRQPALLDVRLLSGAVAAALVSGAVCSATFDSFSFSQFATVEFLLVGLAAALPAVLERAAPEATLLEVFA